MMEKVRAYTETEAITIRNSPLKFYPVKDANGVYYLRIEAAKALSQNEGFEWAAPNESNLITYKPTTDV